ncbi:MAG: sterol desaturase family protein [Alphaproteobacteria bacterium]|nr:sterol desaturase family protein [Alphaproteobacteria bacterium]
MEPWVEQVLALKVGVIGGWLVLWLIWERVAPRATRRFEAGAAWGRWAKNLGLFAINTLASPLMVVPLTAWAASHGLGWRPDWWSGAIGLAIDLIILDCFIYWWHRANHEVPFLWRFHRAHHWDQDLDVTTAVRFHIGEVLLSALVRGGFMILIDVPLSSVLVFEIVLLASSLFHHSNARLPVRVEAALSRLIITPSIHWVHHHALRADTDSNYGSFFSFWDVLFGSRSRTQRWDAMPIGVEGEEDRNFARILAGPFEPGETPNALNRDA